MQSELSVRHRLLARLAEARAQTDTLFNLVQPEALYQRPIAERHRIVFYLGHIEAFDWNLLHERIFGLQSFAPEFDRLFAFGIDPVDGGLPSDQPTDWPSVAAVRQYNSRVRAALDVGLDAAFENGVCAAAKVDRKQLDVLLHVAIEHRLMHAETLAYMLHQLPFEQKLRPPSVPLLVTAPAALGTHGTPSMVPIPAGLATLGLSRGATTAFGWGGTTAFGWDNEYNAHAVMVPAFDIDQYPVTNDRYLQFMAAGGYQNRAYWADADWEWKTQHDLSHPALWCCTDGQWHYRGMFEMVPLPGEWPVYVSHAEASAYARWAGKALPSEAQWHRAAYGTAGTAEGRETMYPWGAEPPGARHGNFDLWRWDPVPVGTFPAGRSAFDVADLAGNGWEWTSTLFAPFSGFQPFSFYPGYSADFFDGRHYVLKGGSARTAACMLRRSFRNWFQPHYPYLYAGFRCVRN